MTAALHIPDFALRYGRASAEALAETLWPTRCAVCDAMGDVLCDRCRSQLAYIDWWRACPRCGAPFGRTQCTECNDVTLASMGRTEPALDGLANAVALDRAASRVVRNWKDAGERRLATTMAAIMAPYLPPAWQSLQPTVVPIPASPQARCRRGFDHGAELARAVADRLALPFAPVLDRPRTRDQRALTRRSRVANMQGRFRTLPGATAPAAVLLVDDVCTTGATLFAAADALRAAGTATCHALTFARTW